MKKLYTKLANKKLYWTKINNIKLQLPKLKVKDQVVKKIEKQNLRNGKEKIEEILQQKNLLYLPKNFDSKIISKYSNKLLISYFKFNKAQELINQKY